MGKKNCFGVVRRIVIYKQLSLSGVQQNMSRPGPRILSNTLGMLLLLAGAPLSAPLSAILLACKKLEGDWWRQRAVNSNAARPATRPWVLVIKLSGNRRALADGSQVENLPFATNC